jgi:hypothetical protein
MARAPTTSLIALALAALTATVASGQPAQYNQMNNEPQINQNWNPYLSQNEAAQSAPQLFTFPGLSNKSTSVGGPGCMAGSEKNKSRPKVVATFPADGAVVRPGLLVVRVTFDQPMACDASFDGASNLPNPCPGRWREVTMSQDRRSFRTVCEVKADMRYRLTLRSFRNSHGLTIPAEVTFSTSGAAPVATILQALAEDPGEGMAAG